MISYPVIKNRGIRNIFTQYRLKRYIETRWVEDPHTGNYKYTVEDIPRNIINMDWAKELKMEIDSCEAFLVDWLTRFGFTKRSMTRFAFTDACINLFKYRTDLVYEK
jgi:hypothetical protein